MIYLMLRQAGEIVNHKRSVRLQAEKGMPKKIPIRERYPLQRPTAANPVWSMYFGFDRTANGRSIKSLRSTRGLPKAIRTDDVNEFCSHAMLTFGACTWCSVVSHRA